MPHGAEFALQPDGRLRYRSDVLPHGMSPLCLDELSRLINDHQRDDCETSDSECAIKAFLIVQSHLSKIFVPIPTMSIAGVF